MPDDVRDAPLLPKHQQAFAQQQHRALMASLLARETDVLRLLGLLLPPLGGFGVLAYYLECGGLSAKTFILGWVTMQLLLAFGVSYILALAYNFRYCLLQARKLEDHIPAWNLVLHQWQCPRSHVGTNPAVADGCKDRCSGRKKEWMPEVFRPQHDLLWALTLLSSVAPPFMSKFHVQQDGSKDLGAASILVASAVLLLVCGPTARDIPYRLASWFGKWRRPTRFATSLVLLLLCASWAIFVSSDFFWKLAPLAVGTGLFLGVWFSAHEYAWRINRIITNEPAFSAHCRGVPTTCPVCNKDDAGVPSCEPFRRLP